MIGGDQAHTMIVRSPAEIFCKTGPDRFAAFNLCQFRDGKGAAGMVIDPQGERPPWSGILFPYRSAAKWQEA